MQTRRDFLKLLGAVSMGFAGLDKAFAAEQQDRWIVGYGPLFNQGLLELPKGFSYKVIAEKAVL